MDKNWQTVLVSPHISIFSAIKQMDAGRLRVLLVVDETQHLLGIVTDGDIRRYLLTQSSLENAIAEAMNKNPVTASLLEHPHQLLTKMQMLGIFHLPILNHEKRVVGLKIIDDLLPKMPLDHLVVLMAGGVGARLHPLTVDCPKPLIRIGNKPIAEILLENFIDNGFQYFYFSVNYKAQMIRDYFGDGQQFGVDIKYIEENNALGTAGSLSLIKNIPKKSFIVANTDILTKIDFNHLLAFHKNQQSHVTVCVREYENTIPYGVVNIDEVTHRLMSIAEKPKQLFFVSAGMYILEPEVLEFLPYQSYCDMPNFITKLISAGLTVSAFPIHEYWLDIGRHADLEKAIRDYPEVFA